MCQQEDVLQKYYLYQTKTRYYLVGHTRDQEVWRILKFSRLEPQQLEVSEDPTRYSKKECAALIKQIHDGNVQHGGLQLVCEAYGVIGCFRFLEGYYLLVVSKRRYVGSICGHKIYGIAEKGLVQLTHPGAQQPAFDFLSKHSRESAAERRYRKLLLTGLDLTKDFYFSYTYCLSHTLQNNFTSESTGCSFNSMFVWNEFLTRPLRERLGNCQWVVGLIHGFWQQRTLSLFGRMLTLTIIGRRSKYFAGTRYRKRGVSDQGYVANEVETEQLVFVDNSRTTSQPGMSSVVQVRGSIPLYWMQEGHKLKPDIIVQHYDPLYKATQLHFKDLQTRYGSPTVVLNLLKQHEKRPRESVLRTEFRTAVNYINNNHPQSDNKIVYHQYDLNYAAKRKGTDVLSDMSNVLNTACKTIGQFNFSSPATKFALPSFQVQCGVLRTNCIDCLDRTNVAQFAYGLNALGYQLQSLGITDAPSLDRNSSVARQLMDMYEAMGHTLAMQYGGSEAHSKFFQRQRGDWEAAAQSRDLMTSIRRFYSNTYTDAEKQDAINLFLGNFVPIQGQPQLWELESDYYLHTGKGAHHGKTVSADAGRTSFFDLQSSSQMINFGAMFNTSGFSSPLERTTSSSSSTLSVMTSSDVDGASDKDGSSGSNIPSIATLVSRGTLPTGPSGTPHTLPDALNRSPPVGGFTETDLSLHPTTPKAGSSQPLASPRAPAASTSHAYLNPLNPPGPIRKCPTQGTSTSGDFHGASTGGGDAVSRDRVREATESMRMAQEDVAESASGSEECGTLQEDYPSPPTTVPDSASTSPFASTFATVPAGLAVDPEISGTSPGAMSSAHASHGALSEAESACATGEQGPKVSISIRNFSWRQKLRSGDGLNKRLKLSSFDKVLAKQPFGVQPATLYDSPMVQKSAIPQWLASPLGIRRGMDPLMPISRSSIDGKAEACSTSAALSPSQPPLRRTRSDSRLSELAVDAPLMMAIATGTTKPSTQSAIRVRRADDMRDMAGDKHIEVSGIASPPMHYKPLVALTDDAGDALAGAAAPLTTGSKQKMFPFAMFRQQSRTIAAMNIELPAKKPSAPILKRRVDARGVQPLDIGSVVYGADAVVDGEDSLGVPHMVLDWWVNKGSVSEEWWSQESKVRDAYSRYLAKAFSFDLSSEASLGAAYASLCRPGVVVSLDGFQAGAASSWRRRAGLRSSVTVAESELRRIAEGELRSLVAGNEA